MRKVVIQSGCCTWIVLQGGLWGQTPGAVLHHTTRSSTNSARLRVSHLLPPSSRLHPCILDSVHVAHSSKHGFALCSRAGTRPCKRCFHSLDALRSLSHLCEYLITPTQRLLLCPQGLSEARLVLPPLLNLGSITVGKTMLTHTCTRTCYRRRT